VVWLHSSAIVWLISVSRSSCSGGPAAAALELQVGEDREQVRVAAALPEPVGRALHVGGADLDAEQRVRDRAAAVVVEVQPDLARQLSDQPADDLGDVPRHRAAVGVAQHDALGAGLGGGRTTSRA
jgi:hypothetical protein